MSFIIPITNNSLIVFNKSDLILSVNQKLWIAVDNWSPFKKKAKGVFLWCWVSICGVLESATWLEHGKPGFCLRRNKRWWRQWWHLGLEGLIRITQFICKFHRWATEGMNWPTHCHLAGEWQTKAWQWGSWVLSESLFLIVCFFRGWEIMKLLFPYC